jgi:hypothetical protein
VRRGAVEERFAPCLQPWEFLDVAEPLDPVEENVTLQERCIGRVYQRVLGAIEEGPLPCFSSAFSSRSNGTGICSAALL